jgi:hypothetical protein
MPADACEHAEHTASRKLPERFRRGLFRPCVLVATNQPRRFEPEAHVAVNQPLGRGTPQGPSAGNFPACESRPRRGMPLSHVGATALTLVGTIEPTLVGAKAGPAQRRISASSEQALRAVETLSTLPHEIDWRTPRDCVPGP